jgi:hypothetical protein
MCVAPLPFEGEGKGWGDFFDAARSPTRSALTQRTDPPEGEVCLKMACSLSFLPRPTA